MARYNKYSATKETDIENYFKKKIEALGGRAIKFNPHNNRGLPDRICFIPGGLVLLVELKRPGQVPRKNQESQLAFFRKLGFQATWASTYKRCDELIAWLKKYTATHRQGFHVEHICYRKDCVLRRNTGGKK